MDTEQPDLPAIDIDALVDQVADLVRRTNRAELQARIKELERRMQEMTFEYRLRRDILAHLALLAEDPEDAHWLKKPQPPTTP